MIYRFLLSVLVRTKRTKFKFSLTHKCVHVCGGDR